MTIPRFVNLCIVFISLVSSLAALSQTAQGIDDNVKQTSSKRPKKDKVCWNYDDENNANVDIQTNVIPFKITVKDGAKPTKWYYKLFHSDFQVPATSRKSENKTNTEMIPREFPEQGSTSVASYPSSVENVTDSSKDALGGITSTERTTQEGSTVVMTPTELAGTSQVDELTTRIPDVWTTMDDRTTRLTDFPWYNSPGDSTVVQEQTTKTPIQFTSTEFREIASQTTDFYRTFHGKTSQVKPKPLQMTTVDPLFETTAMEFPEFTITQENFHRDAITDRTADFGSTSKSSINLELIDSEITTHRVTTHFEEYPTKPPLAMETIYEYPTQLVTTQKPSDESNETTLSPVVTQVTTIRSWKAPVTSTMTLLPTTTVAAFPTINSPSKDQVTMSPSTIFPRIAPVTTSPTTVLPPITSVSTSPTTILPPTSSVSTSRTTILSPMTPVTASRVTASPVTASPTTIIPPVIFDTTSPTTNLPPTTPGTASPTILPLMTPVTASPATIIPPMTSVTASRTTIPAIAPVHQITAAPEPSSVFTLRTTERSTTTRGTTTVPPVELTTKPSDSGWATPYRVIVPIFYPLVNFTFNVPVRRDFTISFPERRPLL